MLKHHTMKTCSGIKVKLYAFLNSALG